MTVICATLLYRLGHQKKNYKHKQVREKDKKKKKKFQCNSARLYIQMNTNAESISNVSVIKPTLGVTCSLLPNMGAAIALPINH